MDSTDPEAARLAYLIEQTRAAASTEAEREELEIYCEANPDLRREVTALQAHPRAGGAWMTRVEKSRRIEAIERAPAVRAERRIGLGLVVAGFAGSLVSAGVLPPLLMVTGSAILLWSMARIRIRTLQDDPYKDIEK